MLFPRSASALPASDGDIICQRRRSRQKSKVSVDISPQRESEPGTSLFLMQDSCERLFLQTSTDAKAFYLRLVLFRESQIGWGSARGRQPWPCYFCSSYRKRDARKEYVLYGEKPQCRCLYGVNRRASLRKLCKLKLLFYSFQFVFRRLLKISGAEANREGLSKFS